jgi:hypothetical protein
VKNSEYPKLLERASWVDSARHLQREIGFDR